MEFEVTISNAFVPMAKFIAKGVKTEQEALAYARSKLKESFANIGVHPDKMKKALDEGMKGAKVKQL